MKMRKLGQNGPDVSAIGLGCMGMSEFYSTVDESQSIQVIHRALDLGVSLFDTADMYGSGENEKLLGKALSGNRERAVIATKFAIQRGPGGSYDGVSGKPDYVKSACEASLKRLGVDTIDLYYQHRVDPATPIEETVGAMAELVKEGKVRFIGLSEAAPATLERAAKVHPITTLQTEFSLWTREPEDELLATCAKLGTTFVAYSPLGRGFFTGKIRTIDDLEPTDMRRFLPRFTGDNFAKNLQIVDKVNELAKRHGCSSAQLALAWVLSRIPQIVPIPGTTNIGRLEENIGAIQIELSPQELAEIDAISPKGVAAGDRYPEFAMALLNG